MQRAHVVQTVGKLHQQHADVVRHREHQLAEILRLFRAFGKQLQFGKLCHAIDETRNLLAEILFHVLIGYVSVLDRVVQQPSDDGGHVELQLGQDARHFQRMGEIGIARGAELLAVRRHRVNVGAVQNRLVGIRIVSLNPVDQLGLAHQLALGTWLGREIGKAAGTFGNGTAATWG